MAYETLEFGTDRSVKFCGCKYYGNQHGSFFQPCSTHTAVLDYVSKKAHQSRETMLNRIIMRYARSVVRDSRKEK